MGRGEMRRVGSVPFCSPGGSNLFSHTGHEGRARLFIVIRVPSRFAFVVSFRCLKTINFCNVLIVSLPITSMRTTVLYEGRTNSRRRTNTFSVILAVATNCFTIIRIRFRRKIAIAANGPVIPIDRYRYHRKYSFRANSLRSFTSQESLTRIKDNGRKRRMIATNVLIRLTRLNVQVFSTYLVFNAQRSFSLQTRLRSSDQVTCPARGVIAIKRRANDLRLANVKDNGVPSLLVITIGRLHASNVNGRSVPIKDNCDEITFPTFFRKVLPLCLLNILVSSRSLIPTKAARRRFFYLLLTKYDNCRRRYKARVDGWFVRGWWFVGLQVYRCTNRVLRVKRSFR